MMRVKNLTVVVPIVVATTLIGVVVAHAAGPRKGHADLSGYDENLTLSSPATGSLDVRISKDGNSLKYTLSYEGFVNKVRFSHIHLGKPAINGGIMVFLCTNEAPPPGAPVPPSCPLGGGTVNGEVMAADVIGPSGQGIAAGEFGEFIAALLAEASYGNIHTDVFPGGEIRGQISFHGRDKDKDDKDDGD
jgi:CHRD domain